MKLDQLATQYEKSENFAKVEVGVGDSRIVREFLAKKLYTNPVRAVCQEITSNGRDAHRELGNATKPIKIKLPTRQDPSFYIQDFGVGIDKDRMYEIYSQYCLSTKRDGNDQTGGFGIGSKTPFAYSDQFSIVAVTPDGPNGEMMKRTWVILKDEINLVSEVEAGEDDERGTVVVLPVKENDMNQFGKWVNRSCCFWDVRPEIVGDSHIWHEEIKSYESETEGLWWYSQASYGEFNRDYVILDGIPYPIDIHSLNNEDEWEEKYNNLLGTYSNKLRMTFKTGELDITLNREGLEYTERTKTSILSMFKKMYDEIEKRVSSELEGCKTYVEAMCKWEEIRKNGNLARFIDKVQWNGIDISNTNIYCREILNEANIHQFKIWHDGLKRNKTNRIHVDEKHLILFNDTGTKLPSKPRIETVYEKHPSISYVFVICPFNTADNADHTSLLAGMEKHNIMAGRIEYGKLSDYDKIKRTSKGNKHRIATGTVKTFNAGAYWASEFWKTSKIDLEDGGVCVILRNGTVPMSKDGKDLDRKGLSRLLRGLPTVAPMLVGISESNWRKVQDDKKLAKKWVHLEDWLQANYNKFMKENRKEIISELKINKEYEHRFDQHFRCFDHAFKSDVRDAIKSSKSDLAKYIKASEEIEAKCKKSHNSNSNGVKTPLRQWYSWVGLMSLAHIDCDAIEPAKLTITLKEQADKCVAKYGMLHSICKHWEACSCSKEEVLAYLAMVEKL